MTQTNKVLLTFQKERIMWITSRVLLGLEQGIKVPEAADFHSDVIFMVRANL